MLYEINFILNLNYIAYILLGFGIGYLITLGVAENKNTKLDRARDDLAAKKEWIRMLSEQKKENAKKAAWNNKFRKA